jgi:hypothetical protein
MRTAMTGSVSLCTRMKSWAYVFSLKVEPVDLVGEFNKLIAAANAAAAQIRQKQLALPSGETTVDPGAENPKPASADASRREENAPQKQIREAE